MRKIIFYICLLSLLYACGDREYETFLSNTYSLINNTDNPIYCKVYYPENGGNTVKTTTINPNCSLDLYIEDITTVGDSIIKTVISGNNFSDVSVYFRGDAKLVIKDSNKSVLFYGTEATAKCGTENFVLERIQADTFFYYRWVIDSAYIADKACNMDWEDFEEEF